MKFSEAFFDGYRRLRARRGYTCDGCGTEVFSYPERRLCERCLFLLEVNDKAVCPKCGRGTAAAGVCLDCKRSIPAFTRGMSAFVYTGAAAGLVNRFKNGERPLAWFLGESMAALWSKTGLCADVVAPVPLTAAAEKRRGYNQAAELAKVVAGETGTALRGDLLVKTRDTAPQKELTGRERAENVRDAYRVKDRRLCKGLRVVLTDDIMTTGATGSECAKTLLSAGAAEVFFLTAASLAERK